jgi:hypothetical protein
MVDLENTRGDVFEAVSFIELMVASRTMIIASEWKWSNS